jgi:hypothetical protein
MATLVSILEIWVLSIQVELKLREDLRFNFRRGQWLIWEK